MKRYDYGKVICIFVGSAFAYLLVLRLVGPEKRGVELDVLHDKDIADATGNHDINKISKIVHEAQFDADDVEKAASHMEKI